MALSLIKVLIVDDSAFVRKVVREMLSRSPYIDVVGMARDGNEGLEMAKRLKPDVITCDLFMPGMNGVEFVKAQGAVKRIPILILTASAKEAPLVLEALEAGAVDFLQKPTALASDDLLKLREELTELVKSAAQAARIVLTPASPGRVSRVAQRRHTKFDVLLIGVSTGGPQALRYLLPQFPADFPIPIAMVLHMPVGYTTYFAEKLNSLATLEVAEASDGVRMKPGNAFLAAAGKHLALRRAADQSVIMELKDFPTGTTHKPSVDVLFESAARVYRERTLAVVLTGMGDDGKLGAGAIKAAGGKVLTESKESCVVHGMPRSVLEAGLSDGDYPLTAMAERIMTYL